MTDTPEVLPADPAEALDKMTVLADEIHADNILAGWWSDPHTGESIKDTRSRPEMLMLIVSEMSEASDGYGENAKDDKLPHLPMFDVELADTAIRLFDLLGADRHLAPDAFFDIDMIAEMVSGLRNLSVDGQLMKAVNCVSAAMECHRKGRHENFIRNLWTTLEVIFAIAALHKVPLFAVIEEKRAFNATREDHKIENRIKDGGKAY